jgi:uncharacterized protein YdhG (YjbR/CyaY superfamily)
MNLKITKGLEAQRKKEIKEAYISAHTIRERLREILEQEIQDLYKKMATEANFDKPAWSQHHAYLLGESEALRKLINLLED